MINSNTYYAIIQKEGPIFGIGQTKKEAIANANEWLDNSEENLTEDEIEHFLYADEDEMCWIECHADLYNQVLKDGACEYDVFNSKIIIQDVVDVIEEYQHPGCSTDKAGFTCWDQSFSFNEHLIETSENYDTPLTKEAIKSIYKEIDDHHNGQFSHFDKIKYALCTESNEHADGLNKVNDFVFEGSGEYEFYILTFSKSNVVLFLENRYM